MKETIYYPQGFSTEKTSELGPEKVKLYRYLLSQAARAKAYPSQSGFHVRTAGVTKGGHFWMGGNKEYAHSHAFVHGETAVVSGLRDMLRDDPIEAIAWFKEGEVTEADFGRPCGNCRDVMNAYCSPDLILLNGNENSFVYTRLRDFLFNDFRRLNMDHVSSGDVSAALNGVKGGNDVYLPDSMKSSIYGAALVSRNGTRWVGKHYTNVGYDGVTPGLSAVIGWNNSYPLGSISETHLSLSKIVIASEHQIPDVFYRDRQALLEMDEILRRYKNRAPLRIDLVHAKKDERGNMVIYETRRTNTEEWLPHPFSPGAFRMDDVMDAQLRKMIGKR